MINRKSLLLYILLISFAYVCIEVISYVGLRLLENKRVRFDPEPSALSQEQKNLIERLMKKRPPLSGHHPILGWTAKIHSNFKGAETNSQGIRAKQDYPQDVDPKVIRVSAFGDSFTFGSEVSTDETWERQLEDQDPRFEILNFGVGGYGLDQAYLRYLQDGVAFNADIVVIGFMTENIYRNLSVFRPFYHSSYSTSIYTKPRFSLQNGYLFLVQNPLTTVEDYTRFVTNDEVVLREIGNKDYHYQVGYLAGSMDWLPSIRLIKIATRSVKERINPVETLEGSYAPSSEGFHLTTRIFEEFYCAALQHKSLPVVVIYPDLNDLRRHRSHKSKRYEPLVQHLHAKGFRYLDVLNAFIAYDPRLPKDQLTVGQWGHYSRLGNSVVATFLQDYLNKEKLTVRDHVKNLARAACTTNHCCPNSGPRKYTTAD
ncbi:MAG: hypothetical protein NPIRA06_34330 [Nitrospirales bacterium]|nr:MAG: hypothetical protein NPIRA06_34330 [Nitrospirales bacterium]